MLLAPPPSPFPTLRAFLLSCRLMTPTVFPPLKSLSLISQTQASTVFSSPPLGHGAGTSNLMNSKAISWLFPQNTFHPQLAASHCTQAKGLESSQSQHSPLSPPPHASPAMLVNFTFKTELCNDFSGMAPKAQVTKEKIDNKQTGLNEN